MLNLIRKAVCLITFVWCVHVHGTFKGKYTIRVHFVPPLVQGYCQIAKFWNPRSIECALCFCLTGRISRCIPRPGCIPRPSTAHPPPIRPNSTTEISTPSDSLNAENPSTMSPDMPTAPTMSPSNPIESTPTAPPISASNPVESTPTAPPISASNPVESTPTAPPISASNPVESTPTAPPISASNPIESTPIAPTISASNPIESVPIAQPSMMGAEVETTTTAEALMIPETTFSVVNQQLEISMAAAMLPGIQLPADETVTSSPGEAPVSESSSVSSSAEEIVIDPINAEEMSMPIEMEISVQNEETTVNPDVSSANLPAEMSNPSEESSKPADESPMGQVPDLSIGQESELATGNQVSEGEMSSKVSPSASPSESLGQGQRQKKVPVIFYNTTKLEYFHAIKM